MSNSKLFADLAAAELSLSRWGACLRDTRKFQPIMRAEWDRAFNKREALKAQALYADPVRYAIAYPGNAYGIRHLLPADMAARIEAAETDAEIEAALRTPADSATCDAAIAAIESALDVEAPAMSARDRAATVLSIETLRAKAERADAIDAIRLRAAAARLEADLYEAPAMVPQPCQQPQAKARGPARGERRYVEVRDTETGETHRVLTSVATVGVAVVIFTPSNRHRTGALGGMLITHDDIRKAWVFNDEAEARRMLSRSGAPGERVIRAELISDPAR